VADEHHSRESIEWTKRTGQFHRFGEQKHQPDKSERDVELVGRDSETNPYQFTATTASAGSDSLMDNRSDTRPRATITPDHPRENRR